MDINEQIAQVADILAPAADWDLAGEDVLIAAADQARADWLEQLRLCCDGEYAAEFFGGTDPTTGEPYDPDTLSDDPVIVAVRKVSSEIISLQHTLRNLVAYARELSPPGKKYTLEQLATAAHMSVSGVRTMYDAGTVNSVARDLRLGAAKRDADIDSRWR